MNTTQAQIKVNLPIPMKEYLESKANKFGMPLAGYIKHLILKDIEHMDYPTYKASKKTEDSYEKALKEYDKGESVQVEDIDTFFKEL